MEVTVSLSLTSSAFTEGGAIPAKHSCDGADVSPPLAWRGAPLGTVTFALIMDDPDAPAGPWVHWVLFNLPGKLSDLPEGVPKTDALREFGAALQGRNDFHRVGYGGPCPPPGRAHRYCFRLYALSVALPRRSGARKREVERAMSLHVLSEATLMGTCARQGRSPNPP